MKPLNRAERNNAFLGFLLLFFITIGIVMIVVFSSREVPFTENEKLRSKLLVMQKQKDLADSFRVAMDLALNELASFDEQKDPAIIIKRRVQVKIEKLSRLVKRMPEESYVEDKSIYNLMIQNLALLNDAKTKIRNLEDQKIHD